MSKIVHQSSWDSFEMPFGKHKGQSIGEVWKRNPNYIRWIVENFDDGGIKDIALKVLAGEPLDKERVIINFKKGEIHIKAPITHKGKCKSLTQRTWNPKYLAWVAPKRVIGEVLGVFPEGEDVKYTDDFKKEIEYFHKISGLSNQAEGDFDVPNFGRGKEMFPFQRAGVEFIEETGGHALIADQMGLGKTIQTLAYLQLHPEMRPALIICPASLKQNWEKEANSWLETDDTIQILKGKKPTELTGDIIIANYDIVTGWLPKLKESDIKIMILDESHAIKNQKSKRTRSILALSKVIPKCLLLSGTPILNRPIELWTQLQVINPLQYNRKSFFRFADAYCGAVKGRFGWDFSGASNIDKLSDELRQVMIRRTKDQVYKELPPKIRSMVPIQLSNREEYEKVEEEFLEWLAEEKGKMAVLRVEMNHIEEMIKIEYLKQTAANGKMQYSLSWIKEFLKSGEKIVIFATHTNIINRVYSEFEDIAVKIDGSVAVEKRQEIVDKFQNDKDIKVFVGNMQAAGVGITLTTASNVVFLELGWTAALHDQAEDRCHRIGQQDNVNVYYLLAENTIDERISALIESKREVIDEILKEENSLSFKLFRDKI